MFLEIEKEVGVEKRPPPRDHFDGYFYYISRIMLNNLHVWVFVKWELKELKLGVKESQVPGI
jgi:hypothetical protein